MIRNIKNLDAARCAAEVLDRHKVRAHIANGYTRVNPMAIADDEGIALMLRPLDKLLGAFLRIERPGIIVNVSRPAGLVHMTCAHELGHYFLGHATTHDTEIETGRKGTPLESEADAFAYSLLVPRWLLVEVMKRKRWTAMTLRDPFMIYQLSLRLGTSYKAALWSMANASVISVSDAKLLSARGPKAHKEALLQSKSIPDWNADVWLLDDADRDLIIEPHPNDTFVLDLPSHIAAGYSWSTDNVRSEGFVIEPVLRNAAISTNLPLSSEATVGGLGTQRWIVSAALETTAYDEVKVSLALVESQPWMATSPSDTRYETVTEYEIFRKGLSNAEKAAQISAAKVA